MMRTLARQRSGGHGHAGREYYVRGGTPGTRSAPPPQRPSSGRRRQPQQFFYPHGAFEHLRLPASCCQTSIAARAPGYAGTTSWPLPAAISAPWAKSRRHVKSWFGATPWRRATKRTVMPGSNVSSTIRTFSDAVLRRRRLTDVIISTRSAGLVIDTVYATCQVRDRVRSVRGLSHQDRQTRQIEARHSSD